MSDEFITGDWDGVNEQAFSMVKPAMEQNQIFLWLACICCGTKKRFVVTAALKDFMERKNESISYGSTCEHCRRKIKVTLRWEKPDEHWEATKKEVEQLLVQV